MICAIYSLELYCDCEDCLPIVPAQREFTGNTWTDCVKQARKAKWRISKDRQRCYAPGHRIPRTNP